MKTQKWELFGKEIIVKTMHEAESVKRLTNEPEENIGVLYFVFGRSLIKAFPFIFVIFTIL